MPRISETSNNISLYGRNVSSGLVGDLPLFTDNGDGTFDIEACDVLLYDNDRMEGNPTQYHLDAIVGFDATAFKNAVMYLLVEYNNGSPQYIIEGFNWLAKWDASAITPIYTCFNENNNLIHKMSWDGLGQGLSDKNHRRILKTQRFAREKGGNLSEFTGRIVRSDGGIFWTGSIEHNLDQFDSSADVDSVTSINIVTAGTSYTDGTYTGVPAQTSGGSGTALTVTVVIIAGGFFEIYPEHNGGGGSGWVNDELIVLTNGNADVGGTGSGEELRAGAIGHRFYWHHWTGTGLTIDITETVVDGILTTTEVSVNAGGTGYTQDDVIEITGGGGAGATISLDTVTSGVVSAISIVDGGTGYTDTVGAITYEGWTFQVWIDGTGVYNNLHYDGGDGTHVHAGDPGVNEVAVDEYVVNWVYRDVESPPHCTIVLAEHAFATLAEAQGSTPRDDLPESFPVIGFLIGRIIIVKSGSTADVVESAFSQFQPNLVTSHSALAGLQGGATDEYFHLDSAQYQHNNDGFPVVLSNYIESPTNNAEQDIHGALLELDTASPLSTGVPINVSKGIGKVLISLNAGTDFTGSITITGDTVDRDTGAVTAADTEVISVDALTTDNTTTDGNGNTLHVFVGAYMSAKWFTGAIVISTTDVDLTDVDTYQISFEQFNDEPNVIIDTFDMNLQELTTNARVSAHLYTVVTTTGSKVDIISISSLEITAAPVVDAYYRLREGQLNTTLNCTTDGVWSEVFFTGVGGHQSVSMKVWARILPEA